jgi:polyisoprenoid-binding protein YceI
MRYGVRLAVGLAFFLSVFVLRSLASAGTILQQVDSAHSTASLTVSSSSGGNSWNVGVAKVGGTVRWDEQDITKSVWNLTIYPAKQGGLLLNPGGSVRNYQAGNLARYTVMTFQSTRAEVEASGALRVHGTLTFTHVEREADITWSNAYSGADYGPPVERSTSGEVVVTLENAASPASGLAAKRVISGFTAIRRGEFPELGDALVDAIWPIVVEDENCEMPSPKASWRDYQGAICTGHVVPVAPPSQTWQEFGIDYPNRHEAQAPAPDTATIALHLNFVQPKSAAGQVR